MLSAVPFGRFWQARHVARENELDDENEKPHLQETIMAGGGRQRRMSAKALVRDGKMCVSHSDLFHDHNVHYTSTGERRRSSFMVRLKNDVASWRAKAASKHKQPRSGSSAQRRWSKSSSASGASHHSLHHRSASRGRGGSMASITEEES